MTQTMGVNANNDIYIGASGNVVILQGQDAVQAACLTVSKASLGEEVLAVNGGLPFFQAVFSGVPNLAIFESYLRRAIEGVPGVTSVKSLQTRIGKSATGKTALFYTATIENQFGLRAQISGVSP